MFTKVFWVPIDLTGRIALMPRPRGNDWLSDEILYWKSIHITDIVSALTREEMIELDLKDEESLCIQSQLNFHLFSIEDRSVPDNPIKFLDLVSNLYKAVKSGRSLGVHCRMGIGRSSMIVAGVLILHGLSVEEALQTISSARGRSVPDTEEQVTWIKQHFRHCGT